MKRGIQTPPVAPRRGSRKLCAGKPPSPWKCGTSRSARRMRAWRESKAAFRASAEQVTTTHWRRWSSCNRIWKRCETKNNFGRGFFRETTEKANFHHGDTEKIKRKNSVTSCLRGFSFFLSAVFCEIRVQRWKTKKARERLFCFVIPLGVEPRT